MITTKSSMIKSKAKFTILLGTTLLFGGFSQAQESVNTSGGDATGSAGNVAYSIGQVVYTTNNASSGTSAQGVQHAYEIFTIGVHETKLNISISVFPNPTDDNLTLQISDLNTEKLSYQLYDVNGKLLFQEQIITNQTFINISSLPSSSYFIHVVTQENEQIQLFKIIKH